MYLDMFKREKDTDYLYYNVSFNEEFDDTTLFKNLYDKATTEIELRMLKKLKENGVKECLISSKDIHCDFSCKDEVRLKFIYKIKYIESRD